MIKAADIMTSEVIVISPKSTIKEAAKIMASKNVSSLVVVEGNKPVAVVSQDDIIEGLVNKKVKVKDFMTDNFMTVAPSEKFSKISRHLRQDKIKRFPVVENENLVGLITETDILEATRDFTVKHEMVQNIILIGFGLATAFFLFYFSSLGSSIFKR